METSVNSNTAVTADTEMLPAKLDHLHGTVLKSLQNCFISQGISFEKKSRGIFEKLRRKKYESHFD